MEINESNMRTLSEYLHHTLNPDISVRKPAESFLESVEGNQNYPLLLLNLVDKPDVDLTLRIAGAVVFKNYIRRNWKVARREASRCAVRRNRTDHWPWQATLDAQCICFHIGDKSALLEEGGENKIHPNDRLAIKTLIVNLMLKSPESIQKQLSVAVSEIGSHDFPMQWSNLIDEMVEKFASGDFHVINGILQTAHSLFKKYRVQMKSEMLWREIKFVLDKFAQPLTDLMTATMALTKTLTDPASLKIVVSSLTMIGKVFYSLNYQDLPEFFEDNMKTWFEHFMVLLEFDVKELHTSDDEESSVIERLRGQICDCISLYAEKYDEEFEPFLPNFVTAVWTLLVTTGHQPKFDHLVSNALGFLKSVAERKRHADLFRNPTVLSEICNKVVIPNMEFRGADEELFEDNPEEYIRRDIEGSDVDTRRRAACDLVKALTVQFEPEMLEIFGQYVEGMLAQYNGNPGQCWKSKDAACYLITSMVTRGQTQRHGVTQTSQLVDLSSFARANILPELAKPDVNSWPVLKADAIKYLMVFRSVLPPEMIVASLPDLIRHLRASSQVVHTYAAVAIEKIIMLRTPADTPLVEGETLKPLSQELVTGLFNLLDQPGSSENEYVMKAIMRSFSVLQAGVIPFLNTALEKLTQKLIVAARNPSKPHFNHYLFETLGMSIKIVCAVKPDAVRNFEQLLFPPFQTIMQQDVQEFIPYVFQLLSMLLELQQGAEGEIPPAYLALLPFLLAPALWERPGYVKPLVRLLQAGVVRAPLQVIADNRLNGILGVFQKLLASKVNDHEGFYLMQHLVQFLPPEVLQPFLKQIFVLIFTRLQSSKTSKFVLTIIVFFCFFSARFSGSELIALIDSIQPGLFGMVIERLILEDTQKVSGAVERKIVAIGLVKLLCETVDVIEGAYSKYWVPLLKCLIALFELPEDTSRPDNEHFVDVEDAPGYSPAYSQLSSVRKAAFDPLREVGNARLFLAQSLAKLSASKPGTLGPLIGTMGDPEKAHLSSYLAAATVTLS